MAELHRIERRDLSHVKTVSLKASMRNVISPAAKTTELQREMTPAQLSSILFDMAVIRLGVKNAWIAEVLKVKEPAVSKWRSPDYPEGPTYTQLCTLGEDFLYAMKKESERHFGWGRRALIEVLCAMEGVVEAVNE